MQRESSSSSSLVSNFCAYAKAQGTIEYLVILAVVVVVSLVVVGLSINIAESPSQQISTSSSAIKASVGVGGISISNSVAGLDGNGLLVLKGPVGDTLTISKIVVDGVDHNFNSTLVAGSLSRLSWMM